MNYSLTQRSYYVRKQHLLFSLIMLEMVKYQLNPSKAVSEIMGRYKEHTIGIELIDRVFEIIMDYETRWDKLVTKVERIRANDAFTYIFQILRTMIRRSTNLQINETYPLIK